MPIQQSDIQLRLSGGTGNADANSSLGGAISTTDVTAGLFDNVASGEATTGRTEYRCVYVRNNDSTRTLSSTRMWFSMLSSGGQVSHAIGVGSSAVNGVEPTVTNEATPPSGVNFVNPTTRQNGLSIGDIPPGQHRAIWIRRSVPGGSPSGQDGFTLQVSGDSPP